MLSGGSDFTQFGIRNFNEPLLETRSGGNGFGSEIFCLIPYFDAIMLPKQGAVAAARLDILARQLRLVRLNIAHDEEPGILPFMAPVHGNRVIAYLVD